METVESEFIDLSDQEEEKESLAEKTNFEGTMCAKPEELL